MIPNKNNQNLKDVPPPSLLLMTPSQNSFMTGPSLMPVSLSAPEFSEVETDSFVGQSSDFINESENAPPLMMTSSGQAPSLLPPMPPQSDSQCQSPPTSVNISRRYVLPDSINSTSSIQHPTLSTFSNTSRKPVDPFTDQLPIEQPHQQQPSQVVPHSLLNLAQSYRPVDFHWFYCENKIWKAFSRHDSYNMEETWRQQSQLGAAWDYQLEQPIPTEGGRYDVFVSKRERRAVYWEEDVTAVRRASWFYRTENDSRYLPYSETMCQKLEQEYELIVRTNQWHKQVEIPSDEVAGFAEMFVFHSPQSIVHYRNSNDQLSIHVEQSLDSELSRPRVVRRGMEDFIDQLDDGEWQPIDHVVFVVHGIGSTCDLRGRPLVDCVNDLRKVAHQLIRGVHFRPHVGRVEFLPVHWYRGLHSEASGIDNQLQTITLRSIPKLRQYTNNTLIDILFYTSPKYCQTILDTVAKEMMHIKTLFCKRNPGYKGEFSIAAHSLGSVICFDLLSHQGASCEMRQASASPTLITTDQTTKDRTERSSITTSTPGHSRRSSLSSSSMLESNQDGSPPTSLKQLLEKLGLLNILDKLEAEQVDFDSLKLLSDEDLKEMKIPLGPRKKLLGYIKEEASSRSSVMVSRSSVHETSSLSNATTELSLDDDGSSHQQKSYSATLSGTPVFDPLLNRSVSQQVDFVLGPAGTGQPFVKYPQLDFKPVNLFCLGSPIALFLTTRGIDSLGEDYSLPNNPGFYNIFHPFDPVAYRVEMLLNKSFKGRPILIPHHKGRKRMHLELKDSLARMGSDLKSRIITSFKSTWQTINDFARAHQNNDSEATESDMDRVLSQLAKERGGQEDNSSTVTEDDYNIGRLNQGRRVDYVLQEAPLESFNDYLFALSSHACYWTSEDTALFLLKEIYMPLGIKMNMPGSTAATDSAVVPPPRPQSFSAAPPPLSSSVGGVQSPLPRFSAAAAAPYPSSFNSVSSMPVPPPPPAAVFSNNHPPPPPRPYQQKVQTSSSIKENPPAFFQPPLPTFASTGKQAQMWSPVGDDGALQAQSGVHPPPQEISMMSQPEEPTVPQYFQPGPPTCGGEPPAAPPQMSTMMSKPTAVPQSYFQPGPPPTCDNQPPSAPPQMNTMPQSKPTAVPQSYFQPGPPPTCDNQPLSAPPQMNTMPQSMPQSKPTAVISESHAIVTNHPTEDAPPARRHPPPARNNSPSFRSSPQPQNSSLFGSNAVLPVRQGKLFNKGGASKRN